MEIVKWEKPSREMSQDEIDDFYEQPLKEPVLFRFTTSKIELPPHGGSFSLKFVLSGEEHYNIGNRSITLRPGGFMFVNEGEVYASSIHKHTEAISIFAPVEEAAFILENASATPSSILDDPYPQLSEIEVPQLPFVPRRHSTVALRSLLAATDDNDPFETQDCTRMFMAEMLCDLFDKAPPRAFGDIKKRSTRDELRARILRAKQAIDDTHGQFANLDDLAEKACLSKYHFLRYFRAIYGLSPAAYARRRRLEEAARAAASDGNTAQVARKAGYRDIRAFERAYKRVFGKPFPTVH